MARTIVMTTLVCLLGIAAIAAVQDAGRKDGERLKRLFEKPIKIVQPLPGLTAQPEGRLVARTGLSHDLLPSLRLYDVLLERQVVPSRTAFLDARWRGKTVRLGYSVTSEGSVYGPKAFDEFGKEVTDVDLFLDQFRGDGAVRLSDVSTESLGGVMQLRDEVLAQEKAPPKKSERKRWTLVRHHLLMFESDRLFRRLETARKNGESLRQPLKDLLELVAELHRFGTNLKAVLEPKEVGEYRRFLDSLVADATAALEALEGDDAERAGSLVDEKVGRGCVDCHEWQDHQYRKPLKDALATELAGVGFGKGSFVVGVDVRAAGFDPDQAQEMAAVVKALALLAHDVK
ncbi:MAG: hypothetical protein V2A76_12065 [Planctomycetota bacterium]